MSRAKPRDLNKLVDKDIFLSYIKGKTTVEIMEHFKFDRGTVSSLLRKYQARGLIQSKKYKPTQDLTTLVTKEELVKFIGTNNSKTNIDVLQHFKLRDYETARSLIRKYNLNHLLRHRTKEEQIKSAVSNSLRLHGTKFPWMNKEVQKGINKKRDKTIAKRNGTPKWALGLLRDKLKLEEYLKQKVNTTTITDVAKETKYSTAAIRKAINKYQLQQYINWNPDVSIQSKEVYDYLITLLPKEDIIINDRECIAPLEIDFYIPKHNLAIEFNGVYWHSQEGGTTENYHYNKFNEIKNKGIRFYGIFSHEWKHKKHIIKAQLKRIIKPEIINTDIKLKQLTKEEWDIFYNKNKLKNLDVTTESKFIGVFIKNRLVKMFVLENNMLQSLTSYKYNYKINTNMLYAKLKEIYNKNKLYLIEYNQLNYILKSIVNTQQDIMTTTKKEKLDNIVVEDKEILTIYGYGRTVYSLNKENRDDK